jgi:acyl-CoA synthetase (NDP forming)
MTWNKGFEVAFYPKTIAVVGASRSPYLFGDFIANLQNAGFSGRIYPINPKAAAAGQEIHGLKTYPNLASVPEQIDLVTVTIPAHSIIPMLEDCIVANAKNIQIYTAGFRESGTAVGIELEKKLQEVAQRGELNIVGPNCMGLHVPASRTTTWALCDPEPGHVGFIAQSGGHAGMFVLEAQEHGVQASKVISYGNAAVMDSTDFLEYMGNDPDTEIICMYIEGVKDGTKLASLVREINQSKPVIIWKGGGTDSGARAAASHTGALGGEHEIWDTFFKQTGAVRVFGLDELLNVASMFMRLRDLKGNRVAIICGGGGNSVAAADICDRAGLDVPHFVKETQKELLSFIPSEGTITRNPIDIAFAMLDLDVLVRAMELAAKDPNIDAVIFALPPGVFLLAASVRQAQDQSTFEEAVEKQSQVVMEILTKFQKEKASNKPLVIVLQPGVIRFLPGQREIVRKELLKRGIPAYLSLEQASNALGKFLRYHRSQQGS